jgi:NADH-quinone oxidoreductase subunit G
VSFLNPARFEYLFPVAHHLEASAAQVGEVLAALVVAAAEHAQCEIPAAVRSACADARADTVARSLVATLCGGERSALLLGALTLRHPAWADLRALATALAELTGSTLGFITEGANAAGAYLAGVVPHRGPAGRPIDEPGRDAIQMLTQSIKSYLLLNLEPEADCIDRVVATTALERATRVVMLTPYASAAALRHAHVLLPIGTFAETSGTYVNAEGRWQSFPGVATPLGAARPAWKVLRVLANLLGLAGFEQASSEDVREELRALVADGKPAPLRLGPRAIQPGGRGAAVIDLPMYSIDALVRRAPALQATRDGRAVAARY